MFDNHISPYPHWGIRPVLFTAGGIELPSYAAFVSLGLAAGLAVYYLLAKKDKVFNHNSTMILGAGLFSGILGAKIPEWIVNYDLILASLPDLEPLLAGRTIIGGLLGGTVGVIVAKRIMGIRDRRGNQFAPGIALGLSIGRIGCFLAGCCYGVPTGLSWGIDFGDGIPRHPTQLYESLFCLGLFVYLLAVRTRISRPGMLFQHFMTIYLTFRFLIEFIRVEPVLLWGLTGYQLACLTGIVYVRREYWLSLVRKKSSAPA